MARAGGGGAAAPERAGGAARPEPWELSLEEVLKVYEQPINEEQAWAVCFQGCRGLRGEPGGVRRIRDTADILLRRDGSVGARLEPGKAPWSGWGCGRRGGREAAEDTGCQVMGPRPFFSHQRGDSALRDREGPTLPSESGTPCLLFDLGEPHHHARTNRLG